jgi:secretion/DNA translocation related TadE-like protein
VRVAVLVPAAGSGVRMEAGTPKALLALAGEPLLVHAVRRVALAPSVGCIVVAAPAEAVADVAALAAARHAREGQLLACWTARRLAGSQGARVESCRLDGLDAVVVVQVRPPGRAGSFGVVRGRARAGRR